MAIDRFGREIHYLRISLTDRCNLRCVYCMPEDMTFRPRAELMQDDELLALMPLFTELGFNKYRLTGGEPTVRANIVDVVRGIASTPGVRSLSMTTNGVLLEKLAAPLKEAGLQRVNVSIDTLNEERFKRITRCQPYPANAPRFAGDVVGLDLAGLLKAPVFDPLFHPYEGLAIRANTNWIGPDALNAVNALLYPPDQTSRNNRHIGTILEEPPADLATNSALRLVPGCAWFQVEFLMPENPRNAIDNPDINTRTENFRWVDVTPGRTFIFVPDSAANRARIISDGATRAAASGNGSIARSRLADFAEITPESPNNTQDDVTDRRVRTWPYALRVTVRAFDPRGRMSDPIVRSIVHRFD